MRHVRYVLLILLLSAMINAIISTATMVVCILFSGTGALADSCRIEWWGDRSGSAETLETSKTITAASEAHSLIFFESAEYCSSECCGLMTYDPPLPFFLYWDTAICTNGYWREMILLCEESTPECNLFISGDWDVVCDPTVVELAEFQAALVRNKSEIMWSTASEINNAGFNLYRASSEDGHYRKINAALIPAQGAPTEGTSYRFVDVDIQKRATYWYKLEDVDLNGISTMHGPVKMTYTFINRRVK